eukprot:scaffold2014_cov112-Isochrysis_galbana.AAC.3
MSVRMPSLAKVEARSGSCMPMEPRQERVTRRRGSDASFRQSLSSGSAPLLPTAFASWASCAAIAARHQTASALAEGSSASTRSQSKGSAPSSTNSPATSADDSALACSKKRAAFSSGAEAAWPITPTTCLSRSGDATLTHSAADSPHIRPIAIIALCCTDGARSVTSAAMSIARVSDASSAASTFSAPSTSCTGAGPPDGWPCEASRASSCAKSSRAIWNASNGTSTDRVASLHAMAGVTAGGAQCQEPKTK